MRFFLTCYQKSGTHQIMPVFARSDHRMPDVVDRSLVDFSTMPTGYESSPWPNPEGVKRTVKRLNGAPEAAFGHLPYLSEYEATLMSRPTKLIFNVRDPRDVVVAVYYNIRSKYTAGDRRIPAYMDLLHMAEDGTTQRLIDMSDPIGELIEIAASRWPHWLGWLGYPFFMKLKYEDLRLRPAETADKITNFLRPECACPDAEDIIKHALPKRDNPTFRRGIPGEWRELFSPKHIEMAKELLGATIIRLGYAV